MKKQIAVFVALLLMLAGCGGRALSPGTSGSGGDSAAFSSEPAASDLAQPTEEEENRLLMEKAEAALETWKQMGGAPAFTGEEMNSATAARLYLQYCMTTGREINYTDPAQSWMEPGPVDAFVSEYFGLSAEELRENDAKHPELKLFDEELGYTVPVNRAGTPANIKLISAERLGADRIALLLEYEYVTPTQLAGSGQEVIRDRMLLTVDVSANGTKYVSCVETAE